MEATISFRVVFKKHENNASIRMMKHIFAAYNSISKDVQCNIATQIYKSLPS